MAIPTSVFEWLNSATCKLLHLQPSALGALQSIWELHSLALSLSLFLKNLFHRFNSARYDRPLLIQKSDDLPVPCTPHSTPLAYTFSSNKISLRKQYLRWKPRLSDRRQSCCVPASAPPPPPRLILTSNSPPRLSLVISSRANAREHTLSIHTHTHTCLNTYRCWYHSPPPTPTHIEVRPPFSHHMTVPMHALTMPSNIICRSLTTFSLSLAGSLTHSLAVALARSLSFSLSLLPWLVALLPSPHWSHRPSFLPSPGQQQQRKPHWLGKPSKCTTNAAGTEGGGGDVSSWSGLQQRSSLSYSSNLTY